MRRRQERFIASRPLESISDHGEETSKKVVQCAWRYGSDHEETAKKMFDEAFREQKEFEREMLEWVSMEADDVPPLIEEKLSDADKLRMMISEEKEDAPLLTDADIERMIAEAPVLRSGRYEWSAGGLRRVDDVPPLIEDQLPDADVLRRMISGELIAIPDHHDSCEWRQVSPEPRLAPSNYVYEDMD